TLYARSAQSLGDNTEADDALIHLDGGSLNFQLAGSSDPLVVESIRTGYAADRLGYDVLLTASGTLHAGNENGQASQNNIIELNSLTARGSTPRATSRGEYGLRFNGDVVLEENLGVNVVNDVITTKPATLYFAGGITETGALNKVGEGSL